VSGIDIMKMTRTVAEPVPAQRILRATRKISGNAAA
jgi:hypothetical protein